MGRGSFLRAEGGKSPRYCCERGAGTVKRRGGYMEFLQAGCASRGGIVFCTLWGIAQSEWVENEVI